MYQKLFKNFVYKNIGLFILISISTSLSLFGYIFSNSLSNNFLNSINSDSRANLGGDFIIDIGNKPESIFDEFYKNFPYKDDVYLAKEFSIRSAIEGEEIINANIIFFTESYPFYSDFNFSSTGIKSTLITSQNLYNIGSQNQELKVLGNIYKIGGVYQELPATVSSFLGSENIFLAFKELRNIQADDTNSLIEKKYLFKLIEEKNYEDIKFHLENNEALKGIRITDAKDGGDRFAEIITNLKEYINYAVLFSFFLTITIIFIAISSFFIKERKTIAVLRVLGLRNSQLINFNLLLFSLIFIISLIVASLLAYVLFYFIKDLEYTNDFSLYTSSIYKGGLIGIVIIGSSIILPIRRFISSEVNSGFNENFFEKVGNLEKIFLIIIGVLLSLFLGYDLYQSIISTILGIITLSVLYFIIKLLLKFVYLSVGKIKINHFFIYDSIRATIKPGNLSFLMSLSFLIIFSISLFILIFFGNFYSRLKVNLDTDNNFFVLNINGNTYNKLSPENKDKSYAIIKGRISSINGVSLENYLKDSYSGRFTREFNITDNSLKNLQVIKGTPLKSGGVSVDSDFSKSLGLNVGDKITFQIFGIEKELVVQNIRESVDYSINPFFYFQIDKKEFEKFPKSYFLSSYIEDSEKESFKKYIYDLSGGTANFIDVEKILVELREISTKVILVIQALFAYVMIFCILSIVIVSLFFKDYQRKKSHLYMLIGTTKQENEKRVFYEYTYLATVLLVLSIIMISVSSYFFINNNDWLNFSFSVYFKSISIVLFLYIILLLGIKFLNRD